MKKDLLVRTSRWIGLGIATVIILIAVILTAARLFVVLLADHRDFIEKWASQAIHHPVRIGSVRADWKGFEPAISFQNVIITKTKTNKAVIQVKALSIGIDLFHSLLQWQLLPGRLIIRGTHLDIYQTTDHKLRVSGLLTEAQQSQLTEHSEAFKKGLSWLLTEANVIVDDVNVNWHAPDGAIYPVRHLQLAIRNTSEKHNIAGRVTLKNGPNTIPTQLIFSTQLKEVNLTKLQFDANVYLQIKQINLQRWAKTPWALAYLKDLRVKKGLVNLKVWMTWKGLHLASMQGVIQAKQVDTYLPSTKKKIKIVRLDANLAWHQYEDGWSIQADKIHIKIDQHVWPEDHFGYRVIYDKNHTLQKQLFYLDYLRLEKLRDLAVEVGYWPEKLKQWFVQYQPKGVLKAIRFWQVPSDTSANTSQLSLKFNKLGWRAHQQYPGASHVSGSLTTSLNSGELSLNTEKGFIFLPKYYSRPLPIDHLQLAAHWEKGVYGLKVHVSDYAIQTAGLKSRGALNLTVPKSGNMLLDMLASLHFDDLSKMTWFLPDLYLSKKTDLTLTRLFQNGQLSDGVVLFRGPINEAPFGHHKGKFEANMMFNNVALNYYPGWPTLENMNVMLQVNDHSAQASVQNAEMGGNTIHNLQARVADIEHPVLTLSGSVDSTFKKAKLLFQKTASSFANDLKSISITGPLKLDMHLAIPFMSEKFKVHYGGKLYLQGSNIAFARTKFSINNVRGLLGFSNMSFYSKDLSAQVLNRPLSIKVLTLKDRTKSLETEVLLGGHLDLETLRQQFALPKFQYIVGGADFRALMQFHLLSKNKLFEGTFVTDLNGIKLKNLPRIFDKKLAERHLLQIQMTYSKQSPAHIKLDYNKQVSAAFSLNHQFKLLSGELYFGDGEASFQDLPGFVIDGRLVLVNWAEWSPYIMPFVKEKNGAIKIPKIFGLPLRYIEFHFGKVVAYHQTFDDLYFKLIPRLHDWVLNLQNNKVAGILFFPSHSGGTWSGRFEHLYIPKITSKTDKALPIDPRKIPPINLVIKDFQYGSSKYGEISVATQPTTTGLSINTFSMKSAHFDFSTQGFWKQVRKKQKTFLTGYFQSQNLGDALSDWGIKQVMAKGSGTATFSLAWPSAPNQFSMKIANGNVHFNFHHGRLLQTQGASTTELSLGRLLNVFSIQSLLRRLTLNFSDITAKGLEFHTLKGGFVIKHGIASTNDAYLDGPVVKIKVKGKVNFLAKQYDLHLSVAPYVTSSLPLIIGVVGGPVAGAVAWVVNKIVSPEIGKAVGFNYDVKASWDKTKLVKLPVPAATYSPGAHVQ